jgi:hypothetical protein
MTEDLKSLAFEMQRRGIPPRYFAAQMRRGMKPEEIFAAWPQQTHLDRVGSQHSRRRLVIAAYGGWLLVALLAKLLSSPDSAVVIIPLVGLANGVAALILLSRRSILNREVLAGDSGLDERLIQNRNQAFRIAFQVFAPIALIAWAVTVLAIRLPGASHSSSDALLIYLGVALLGTTLPAAIWIWREPDPAEPEPPTR